MTEIFYRKIDEVYARDRIILALNCTKVALERQHNSLSENPLLSLVLEETQKYIDGEDNFQAVHALVRSIRQFEIIVENPEELAVVYLIEAVYAAHVEEENQLQSILKRWRREVSPFCKNISRICDCGMRYKIMKGCNHKI